MPLPAHRPGGPRARAHGPGGGLLSGTASSPRAVERVRAALRAAGLDPEVRMLDVPTRTAPEAAAAVGCELGAIVKSLVFAGARSGRPLLALVSGVNRADESRLEDAFGEPVSRADAGFVRTATGFAIGGVPPLGHATAMRPLVDRDLLAFGEVWCAAGTPHALFPIAPPELVRVTDGRVAALAVADAPGRG